MAGTITALELQKKNKERVNVFLDGQYAFSLSLILAAQLKRGQYLSQEQVTALKERDDRDKAYDRSLNYLSYRPRSRAEIERYLTGKGCCGAVIEDVINRLTEGNLLDDVEFARFWVENRQRFRPRGRMALFYEMRSKGLDEETISEALEDVDEEQLAYDTACRQAQKTSGGVSEEFRHKLRQYLARRGFSFSVINTVLRRLEDDMGLSQDQ